MPRRGSTGGFTAHPPALDTMSGQLNRVGDALSEHAGSVGSAHPGSGAFGVVGQGLEGRLGGALSQMQEHVSGMAGGAYGAGQRTRASAADLRETEQRNSDMFNGIRPSRGVTFNPATTVHGPDGSVSQGQLGGEHRPPPAVAHPGPLNPAAVQSVTGQGTSHQAGPHEVDGHPLKVGDSSLTAASYGQSQQLASGFPNKTRPGMASGLLIGDSVLTHSSMKGGDPNRHPVVSQVLEQIPHGTDANGRPYRSNGHGQCAEVGAISDYLHHQNPAGDWSAADARAHFEHVGAATTAHTSGGSRPTDACVSCQHLTGTLGIAWITRPIGETAR